MNFTLIAKKQIVMIQVEKKIKSVIYYQQHETEFLKISIHYIHSTINFYRKNRIPRVLFADFCRLVHT